jgi:hypothetical protein
MCDAGRLLLLANVCVLVVLARIVRVVEGAHRAPVTIPQREEHDGVLDGVFARTLYHELHVRGQEAASSPILNSTLVGLFARVVAG